MELEDLSLNLDDLDNSSDDGNDVFYQSTLNNREPKSYVQKPFLQPELSDIAEESNESSTSKQVRNETFRKRKYTVRFEDNPIEEEENNDDDDDNEDDNHDDDDDDDNSSVNVNKSRFNPSIPYSRTRSRFINDLFLEIEDDKDIVPSDDDLFGSKTDKASYDKAFATPDTISLCESQNLGSESDTPRNSNTNMMSIAKSETATEHTDDLFGLNRPSTSKLIYKQAYATPDTISLCESQNLGTESDTPRNSNTNMMSIAKSETATEPTDDLFGLNRPSTSKLIYKQAYATPDTISLCESQNLGTESDTPRNSNTNMMSIAKSETATEHTDDLFGLNRPSTRKLIYQQTYETPQTVSLRESQNLGTKPENARKNNTNKISISKSETAGEITDDLFGLNRPSTSKLIYKQTYETPHTVSLRESQNLGTEPENARKNNTNKISISKSETAGEISDDLFGLNRPSTSKLIYQQAYETPHTMSLRESRNLGSKPENARKNNTNKISILKSETAAEMTDDLFGVSRPRTGAAAETLNYDGGQSTQDTILSNNIPKNVIKSKSKTFLSISLRPDNSGKGDWLGLDSITNQRGESVIVTTDNSGKGDWLGLDSISNEQGESEEPLAEETPRPIPVFVPQEKKRWEKVLTNELLADNISNITPIDLPSSVLSSNDELPPTDNITEEQARINNNNNTEIPDVCSMQRLRELKDIASSLRLEMDCLSAKSCDKNIQVDVQPENTLYGDRQQDSNNYSSETILEQSNNRSSVQTRSELNVSQIITEANPDENILPTSSASRQHQHVPKSNAKSRSKQNGHQHKRKSKSGRYGNQHKKSTKSEQNNVNYSSESTQDPNIIRTSSESEERNVPDSYSGSHEERNGAEHHENQTTTRSKSTSEPNNPYFLENLLKNMTPEQILAYCPKYLEMESKILTLQLENERLTKFVDQVTEITDYEVNVLKISQDKSMELQKNYQHMLEMRLEAESRELKEYFEGKLQLQITEATEQRNKHELEIAYLKNLYEEKLKTIQMTQKQTLDIFKEQQHIIIEKIREAKLADNIVPVREADDTNPGYIAAMTEKIAELRDQLVEKWNAEQKIRENKIAVREEKLNEDIRQFETMQQNYEDNKERIMGIISQLELKLVATVQESNEQNWKIRSELNRIHSWHKYLEFENERMLSKFKREEERLSRLKLNHMREIQQNKDELQKARDSMARDQAQLDNERQALMANDPYFNRGRFEAESILKLAGQTMEKIQRERQLLAKQQIEIEQCRHYFREKEATIEKREDEVEQCKEKANKLMNNAYELKKQATREIKEYCVLKEEMIIYGERITNDKKHLHGEYEKLVNERLQLSRAKVELENIKGRCWWCRLMTKEKVILDQANDADILTELGFGSLCKIGTLEPLPDMGISSAKPAPFNFNVQTRASYTNQTFATTSPPASTLSQLPSCSTDADTIDHLLDKNVKKAMNRAHQRRTRR